MISSGKEASKYYAGVAQPDNYYMEERGIWGGKGSEKLGLIGEVKSEQFKALSMNRHPATGEKLTVRWKLKRTSGYDICFSVPKSVSIYLNETGDKRVEMLILEAFKEVMSRIEQGMETSVRKDGRKENRVTGNMIYAAFVHRLARPVDGVSDPQFHVHGFVLNATFDVVENRWKAGQFGSIVTLAPQFQNQFHEALIAKLDAAGIKTRRTKHAFEIASISRDLIERFSRRAKIIGEAAAKFTKKVGKELAQVKSAFARSTREKKSANKLSETEQLGEWRGRMTPFERAQIHGVKMPGQRPRAIMNERFMAPTIEQDRCR